MSEEKIAKMQRLSQEMYDLVEDLVLNDHYQTMLEDENRKLRLGNTEALFLENQKLLAENGELLLENEQLSTENKQLKEMLKEQETQAITKFTPKAPRVSKPNLKKYYLSEVEIAQFLTEYQITQSVEKALKAIGKGMRYHKQAKKIAQQHQTHSRESFTPQEINQPKNILPEDVSQDTLQQILKAYKENWALRDIAQLVKMSGSKYRKFKTVCNYLGIPKTIEQKNLQEDKEA